MEVIKYVGGPVDANCYVIKLSQQAIVIDPCVSLDIIKKMIGDHKLNMIILTHGHFDHICNLKELEEYYNAPIYLAKEAIEKLEDPNLNLSVMIGNPICVKYPKDVYHIVNDYEKISIDGAQIVFIHTKGHSSCSICIRIDNHLFTGDTLFKGGIGRCDLYSGNTSLMRESLKKLANYFKTKCDGDMIIHPGHEDESTVNFELEHNPYLKGEGY